jgi:hypothetical protein
VTEPALYLHYPTRTRAPFGEARKKKRRGVKKERRGLSQTARVVALRTITRKGKGREGKGRERKGKEREVGDERKEQKAKRAKR